MAYTTAILFLIASLGVIHGLLLGGYTLAKKAKLPADLYFGGLLLVLSIRIGKSIIYYFDPTISKMVLQVGLSACIFVGPFFAFFVEAKMNNEAKVGTLQVIILSGLLLTLIAGWLFPYQNYPDWWNHHFVAVIYSVWLLFFALGVKRSWPLLRQLSSLKKLDASQKYLLGVIAGTSFITATYQFAYHISGFTYIWGALIFTFSFYFLAIREFLLVRKAGRVRAKKPSRPDEADRASFQKIEMLIGQQKLYRNPKLQLKDLALAVDMSPHHLSRLLNAVYPHGFSQYVNEKRVVEAQRLMSHTDHLSLEGIGYEAGFNSKSAFFSIFKKTTGQTPAQYKREGYKHKKPMDRRPTL